MIIDKDTPNLLLAGLQPIFMKKYTEAPSNLDRIATTVNSTKSTEPYAWLGEVTTVNEWKDDRKDSDVKEHNFSIANRDWEASIAVDRNAIEDDQYGQIQIRVKQLASRMKQFPEKLCFQLLEQGNLTTGTSGMFTGKTISCYDGQAFFSASHPVGSTVQSNIGSTALGVSSTEAAMTAMMRFKDDKGEPRGVTPDLLITPPDLQWTARELLNSAYFPEEGTTTAKLATNVLKGLVDLLVVDWLTDTNNWYLFYTKDEVKPMIFQNRRAPEFIALTTGSDAFMRKKWWYGVDSRSNVGFAEWRNAYGAYVS